MPTAAPAPASRHTPGFDGKRQHVLHAAAHVFAEDGYDKASMRRVAAEAGVSLAGIYHYVAGKDELLFWIQVHTFDSLLQGLESSLEGIADPRQRLAAAVRNHVRHFGRHMDELKVCAHELQTLKGAAYVEVQERRRSYFEALHRLVRDLAPDGGRPPGSWLATANLFGMLNWFYQWYDAGRSQVGLDELAAQQTELFLDGYLASAAGGPTGASTANERIFASSEDPTARHRNLGASTANERIFASSEDPTARHRSSGETP